MKLWQSLLISFFLAGSIRVDAFNLELSQLKTDDQSYVSLHGAHIWKGANVTLAFGGKMVESSDRPREYTLGANGRFRLMGPVNAEFDFSTHNTHDAGSAGLGYTMHQSEQLEVYSAILYTREYDSPRFRSFLQGSYEDLLRAGGEARAWAYDKALIVELGAYRIQNYDADARTDGFARIKMKISEYIYVGTSFDRTRFVDTYRSYVGINFN